jgi:hypothetical protein
VPAVDPASLPQLGPDDHVGVRNFDLMQTALRIERPECPICYEEFRKLGDFVELTCGHFYHRECLDQWRGMGKTTCPICRRQIALE